MYWVPFLLLCAHTPSDLEFDNDILPILTKAGCNAAACHGAAAGRGGFKLSLFGGDPSTDYDAVVREFQGRRINYRQPGESLLVAKPAGELDHEGGQRFQPDSVEAELLKDWIRSGAGRNPRRRLTRVQAIPARFRAASLPAETGIKVWAEYSDGTRRDVSGLALYTASDPSAVRVDEQGKVAILRGGRHALVVRYGSYTTLSQLTAPLGRAKVELGAAPERHGIDARILATLRELQLSPAEQAEPALLHRRLWLDLTGRLPSAQEVERYLADARPDRYPRLVDRLLGSVEFTDYWTYKFAKLFRIQSRPGDARGAEAFHAWLRARIENDDRLPSLARELLMAEGDSQRFGPANFYRVTNNAREQAEYVSQVMMGVRLRCANCHNHPLDKWTQDDYHGLAAIFARIDQGRVVRTMEQGTVIHPGAGEPARPRIPGERFLDPGADGREAFSNWLLHPDNPYFARAQVNRLWKAFMGRGLVEPLDDLRQSNPPTHPELLDDLARDFWDHQGSLRHLARQIVLSQAYRRRGPISSRPLSSQPANDRYYTHALERPLEPEVLADAIRDATGVAERYGDYPLGTRAVSLVDPRTPSTALDVLGRCPRTESCADGEDQDKNLARILHWINGPLINRKIQEPTGRVQRWLAEGGSNDEIVERLYLHALSRSPTEQEKRYWRKQLAEDDPRRRSALIEDFAWSLLSCREFITNH